MPRAHEEVHAHEIKAISSFKAACSAAFVASFHSQKREKDFFFFKKSADNSITFPVSAVVFGDLKQIENMNSTAKI